MALPIVPPDWERGDLPDGRVLMRIERGEEGADALLGGNERSRWERRRGSQADGEDQVLGKRSQEVGGVTKGSF